jgi:hypothetical protein
VIAWRGKSSILLTGIILKNWRNSRKKKWNLQTMDVSCSQFIDSMESCIKASHVSWSANCTCSWQGMINYCIICQNSIWHLSELRYWSEDKCLCVWERKAGQSMIIGERDEQAMRGVFRDKRKEEFSISGGKTKSLYT